MDILKRIEDLRIERGWSIYKLTSEAGLTQSTLSNMYSRSTLPSITTLESICRAFGISLAQFFTNENEANLSDNEYRLISVFRSLDKKKQIAIINLCENLE